MQGNPSEEFAWFSEHWTSWMWMCEFLWSMRQPSNHHRYRRDEQETMVIAVHIEPQHSFILNILHSTVLMAEVTNTQTWMHWIIIRVSFHTFFKWEERHSVVSVYGIISFFEQKNLDLPFESRMCWEMRSCMCVFCLLYISLWLRMHQYKERIEMKFKNAIAMRDMMCRGDNEFMNINANFAQYLLKIAN